MISENYFLLAVLFLTIGTVLIRGSFIAFSSKMQISNKVKEFFTFIPAALFPALILPASFFHTGHVSWLLEKERFFSIVLASVFCYFIRNTLAVICFGLFVLYLLTTAG